MGVNFKESVSKLNNIQRTLYFIRNMHLEDKLDEDLALLIESLQNVDNAIERIEKLNDITLSCMLDTHHDLTTGLTVINFKNLDNKLKQQVTSIIKFDSINTNSATAHMNLKTYNELISYYRSHLSQYLEVKSKVIIEKPTNYSSLQIRYNIYKGVYKSVFNSLLNGETTLYIPITLATEVMLHYLKNFGTVTIDKDNKFYTVKTKYCDIKYRSLLAIDLTNILNGNNKFYYMLDFERSSNISFVDSLSYNSAKQQTVLQFNHAFTQEQLNTLNTLNFKQNGNQWVCSTPSIVEFNYLVTEFKSLGIATAIIINSNILNREKQKEFSGISEKELLKQIV